MTRRPIMSVLIAGLLVVAGVALGPTPASAIGAVPDGVVTSEWSSTVVHPGETVSLTTTFTNREAEDVVFVYLTVNTHYDTITDGTRYSWMGCTGDAADCPVHPYVPIAPGASRTVTNTWRIAEDSPCGEGVNLAFFYYLYFETSSVNRQGLGGPSEPVTVLCA